MLVLACACAAWGAPIPARAADEAAPPTTAGGREERVTVQIRGRAFLPPTVTLHAGTKTVLVFHNQDAELHAFVPFELFNGLSLNVGGSGAPEFGTEGFKRVIIPSQGIAELRFMPDRPGTFRYICDMPGHEMKASIVVE
jgi:plastocyanin